VSTLGLDRLTFRFWLLGLAQAAHSLEETRARLYEFFWTATGRLHEILPAVTQIGHAAGAIWFRGYVPGVATAPLLFVTGVLLLRELSR
jgi:hypothetical protein